MMQLGITRLRMDRQTCSRDQAPLLSTGSAGRSPSVARALGDNEAREWSSRGIPHLYCDAAAHIEARPRMEAGNLLRTMGCDKGGDPVTQDPSCLHLRTRGRLA